MVGVWTMCLWEQMGQPEKINLVELGPGRGTLIADLLRVRSLVFICLFITLWQFSLISVSLLQVFIFLYYYYMFLSCYIKDVIGSFYRAHQKWKSLQNLSIYTW